MTRGGEYPRYTGLDDPNGSKAVYQVLARGVRRLERYACPEEGPPAKRWSCSQVTIDRDIPTGKQFVVAHSLGRGCTGHDYSLLRMALETFRVVRDRDPQLVAEDSVRMHLDVELETSAIVLDTAHTSTLSLEPGFNHPFVPTVEGQSALSYCGALPSVPSLRLVLDSAYALLTAADSGADSLEGIYRQMLTGICNDPHYGAVLGTRPSTSSA